MNLVLNPIYHLQKIILKGIRLYNDPIISVVYPIHFTVLDHASFIAKSTDADYKENNGHRCGNCWQYGVTARCSRCKSVFYCNTECQGSHWKEHKKVCRKNMVKLMDVDTELELEYEQEIFTDHVFAENKLSDLYVNIDHCVITR